MDTTKIEKMLELGSEWEKGTLHRIYFNDLPTLYGLTGERGSYKLDGNPISNTAARDLFDSMTFMKIWFDFSDGQIHGKWNDCHYNEKSIFKAIVTEIRKRIS